MAKLGAPKSKWWEGLLWGGALLGFGLMFVWLFAGQVADARREAPTLSPTSLPALELDLRRELLVDVEGFTIDCENPTYHGERLLAPAFAADRPAMLLVAFEHGSDCRESKAELDQGFRAKATAMPPELRRALGLEPLGVDVAIVEPHDVEYWLLIAIAVLFGLGGFGLHSAWAARRQLLAPPVETVGPLEPPEPDDRHSNDPYRPGERVRLITEALSPAPAFLAMLRRVRRLQIGLGLIVLAAGLTWLSWGSERIWERERIWNEGIVAEDAIAQGETRRSLLILVSTDLDVTYVDRSGRVHREEASASSLFVGVDDDAPPEVRYLADDPDRFAVSWIHEQLWGSVALLLLGSGGLLALGGALIRVGRRYREPEQVAAAIVQHREALLDLLYSERQVLNGSETGAITHHFRIRQSERACSRFIGEGSVGPLFLDDARSVALALYDPRDPDFLLVLSEDLHELDKPPFTPAQLRGRYQATSKASDDETR